MTAATQTDEAALRAVGKALNLAARSGAADVPQHVEAMREISDRMYWIVEGATGSADCPDGFGRAWYLIDDELRSLWTAPNGETDPRTPGSNPGS